MRAAWLHITLLDDCVFSQSSITEGQHTTLDYLPGATLLGAAAARHYGTLDTATSYRLFHSGQLRFGNALPLHEAQPAYPMPLAWHQAKNGTVVGKKDELTGGAIYNLAHNSNATLPNNEQPKQLRTGYVTTGGQRVTPHRALRMKTAIAAESGRAAESQLFGYEAIAAGQQFLAQISADEAIGKEEFDLILNGLSGELLLGRSRSAEYGRAHIAMLPHGPKLVRDSRIDDRSLTLWLLSDLALHDDNGIPTLEPRPEYLGLAHGEIDWDRTFLRTRRYAPWNGYRKARDMERSVISQGSIITLTFKDGRPAEEQIQRLEAGIGLYREAGLGRVWIDPPLLAGNHPHFTHQEALPITLQSDTKTQSGLSPLISWLEAQVGQRSSNDDIHKQAKEWCEELKRWYTVARTINAVSSEGWIGPSASQWGGVQKAASKAKEASQLEVKLFDSKNGLCRARSGEDNWGAEFHDGKQLITFAAWFKNTAKDKTPRHIAEFARMARIYVNSPDKNNKKEVSRS